MIFIYLGYKLAKWKGTNLSEGKFESKNQASIADLQCFLFELSLVHRPYPLYFLQADHHL